MGKRTSKVIGFSVPPEIFKEVLDYAKKENKKRTF